MKTNLTVTEEQATSIAIGLARQHEFAPFRISAVIDDDAQWLVCLEFEKHPEFEDDPNSGFIVISKSSGLAKLIESL